MNSSKVKRKKISIGLLFLIAALVVVPGASATPKLTLTLNSTMDGTSPPLVSNITKAVLFDTSSNTVATATLPDNMTAQFNLSGISQGDYFIEVNGLAGDHLPTRIDSNASDINQSVGLRLRNSIIGDISNPDYRIKVYPFGSPPVVNSSHQVVNYATGANEPKYGYVIVNDSIKTLEVRVLDTASLLSTFTPTTDPHPSDGTFASEPFKIWILGDVTNSTGAFIGNHGHLYNASNDHCSGCHGNVSVKLSNYSDITPPFTSSPAGGWCFKCHNGPGGPRNGFVDPTNGTIMGNVINVSSGLAIRGATVTADGMTATTDTDGSYNISIGAGIYNVTASAPGFQNSPIIDVVVTKGNITNQNFSLTPTVKPSVNGSISGTSFNDSDGNGIMDLYEVGLPNQTIVLINSTGAILATTTTDINGAYKFSNLLPGNYTVGEVVMSDWKQTTPPTGTYAVTITSAGEDVTGKDFGNMLQNYFVYINNSVFDRKAITIPMGATVTWKNFDTAVHTVTADNGSFSSGILLSNMNFSQTFSTRGIYGYHSSIHPSMIGSVIVVAPSDIPILSYYRSLGTNPNIVETQDLLKAADDWSNNRTVDNFTNPITTQQLLILAEEWSRS
jgi:plastocyanin